MSVFGYVNSEGNIVVPEEIRKKYGLKLGSLVKLEEANNRIIIHLPVTHLARVYIEPTNMCSLQGVPVCIMSGKNRRVKYLWRHSNVSLRE